MYGFLYLPPMRWGYLFLPVFLFSFSGNAAAQEYRAFNRVTAGFGLEEISVLCIEQDHQGMLWFGTDNGLYSYDSKRMKCHYADPQSDSALHSTVIFSIREDRKHRLWIGTELGLYMMDRAHQQFIRVLPRPGDSLVAMNVQAIYAADDGKIWFGYRDNLGMIDPERYQFRSYPIFPAHVPYYRRAVSMICPAGPEDLWITSIHGLSRMNIRTGKNEFLLTTYQPDAPPVLKHVITALLPQGDSILWLGTYHDGLVRYRLRDGQWQPFHFPLEGENEPSGRLVTSVLADTGYARDGMIWVGSYTGLHHFNTFTGEYSSYCHRKDDPRSPDNTRITSLYAGSENILWIGSWSGLNNYDPLQHHFQYFPFPKELPAADMYGTTCFAEDTLSGAVYIATHGSGIFRFDREKHSIIRVSDAGGASVRIHDMYVSGGDYLVAASDAVRLVHIPTGRMETLSFLPFADVITLEPDTGGWYWAFTFNHGFFRFHPFERRWEYSSRDWNFPHTETWVGFSAAPGKLWVGTIRDGVYYLEGEKVKQHHTYYRDVYLRSVHDFAADNRGGVWIATVRGLYRFAHPEATPRYWGLSEGLPTQLIFSVQAHRSGYLYAATAAGLYRYALADSSYRLYTRDDGLFSNRLDYGCLVLRSGQVMVGQPDGFCIAGAEQPINTFVPPIAVTRFTVNGKSYPLPQGDTTLHLGYRENNIQVDFAALSYSQPRRNGYAYRLDGLENDWNYTTGDATLISYPNLNPGHYTLHLKVSNSDGVWNEKGLRIRLVIAPPFWRTGWFYALAVLVFISLVYLVYRYRLRHLLKIQMIRNRIANDLHDDIGASLSSISLQSRLLRKKTDNPDIEKKVSRIEEISAESLEHISDIVWSITTRNDSFASVISRMESHGQSVFQPAGTVFIFKADVRLPQLKIGMESRKNLFLLYKEAVNNILKYAQATEVHVELRLEGKQLELRITDNGVGFDTQAVTQGNGLRSMQARAAEMKGKLDIRSAPGEGTQLLLRVKTTSLSR